MAVDWDSLVIGPTVGIFGERVRYEPKMGRPFHINGVFDQAYIELTPLGRGGIDQESFSLGSPGSITTEMPVLGIQLSQFPQPPEQEDILIARGERYAVKEVRLDGHGGAKLTLNVIY